MRESAPAAGRSAGPSRIRGPQQPPPARGEAVFLPRSSCVELNRAMNDTETPAVFGLSLLGLRMASLSERWALARSAV